MGKLALGIETARPLRDRVAKSVASLKKEGVQPTLAIVRVGANEADIYYESSAIKRMDVLGIDTQSYVLDEHIEQDDLNTMLQVLSEDDKVSAVLLMRPLPAHLSEEVARDFLVSSKDVDGMTTDNIAGVFEGKADAFAPCTARACMEILKHEKVDLTGKNVAVVGRSLVVGRPLACMLLAQNATPTICHTKTKNIEDILKRSDIIIMAAGSARMLKGDMVSPGAIVIDVGINVDDAGKLVGDVDFDEVEAKASLITPVPRGVGSVTTTVLAEHVLRAALT